MNGSLKWVLIGGAVLYLLRDHIEQALGITTAPATTAAPPATTTAPAGTPPASTPPASTPPPAAPGVWDQIAALGAQQPDYNPGQTLTTHEWNAVYQVIRGTSGPDPAAIGQGDGSRRITFGEYKTAMTAAGLSGIGARTIARPTARRGRQLATRGAWGY